MRIQKASRYWSRPETYPEFLEIEITEARQDHRWLAKSIHGKSVYLGFLTKEGQVEFYKMVK